MEAVRQQLHMVDERVVPLGSDAELEFALLDNPLHCFAVNFQNASSGNFQYAIRTKNNNFRTEAVYSGDVYTSYQKQDNEYIESGFLALQNAIDVAFVNLMVQNGGANERRPLHLAYGHIPVDGKQGPQGPTQIYQVVGVLCFGFTAMSTYLLLLPMVEERANGMKEYLKIATASSYWNECALFAINLAQFYVVMVICLAITVASGVWDTNPAQLIYLFLLGLLFVANVIAFTFFISTTLESATIATAVAPVAFVGPLILSALWVKLLLVLCLFPINDLFYMGGIFQAFKSSGHLFTVSDLFTVGYPGLNRFSLFGLLLFQLLGMSVWIFLWYYVSNVFPGRYGTPKPKCFFLRRACETRSKDILRSGSRSTNKITAESQHELQRHSSSSNELAMGRFESIDLEYVDQAPETNTVKEAGFKESPATYSEPLVRITNLYKVFTGRTGGAKEVVKNFSLTIYRHSITVLLGHNGAGKTTTMNIVTGILPRTSGSIVVDGEHDANRYRQKIGFCPQHNVFFSYLTCREHLEFFGRLRGLTASGARNKADIVLEKVNLLDKSDSLVHTLSGGMKRRLSLANAIIGNTELLILDEPTSGLDPESRRDIWDVLLKLRHDHTILLTTHFMEEADVLGDWVAIMEEGQLVAFGSPLHLKQVYGKGYTLKLLKKDNFDERKTLGTVQHHIPGAIVRDSVKEIFAVTLPYEAMPQYPALLQELEEAQPVLGIESIDIANATLEEVFLSSSIRQKEFQRHPESIDCVDSPSAGHQVIVADSPTKPAAMGSRMTPVQAKNVCVAIWRKKWIHMRSNKHIYGWLLALPLLVTVLCFPFTSGITVAAKSLPAVTLTAAGIRSARGIIVINRSGDHSGDTPWSGKAIQSDIARSPIGGVQLQVKEDDSLVNVLQELIEQDYTAYRDRVVVGIECNVTNNDVQMTVLYNNNLVHSTGIAESVATTLLLRYYADVSNAAVETQNIPSTRKQLIDIQTPYFFTEFISLAFMFYMLLYLSVPLQEHLTGFRQLQNINRYVYWSSTYTFDLLVHLIVCLLVILLVNVMDSKEAFTESSKWHIFFTLFLYGMLALLVIYIISQCVESTNTAITIMSYLMIVGVGGVFLLSNGYDDIKNNSIPAGLMHIIPEFALKHSMRVVYENQKLVLYEQMSKQLDHRQQRHAFASDRIYPHKFYILAGFVWLLLVLVLNEVVENIYTREKVKMSRSSAEQNIRRVYRQVSRTISREDYRSKVQQNTEQGQDVPDGPAMYSEDVDKEKELVKNLLDTADGCKEYAIVVDELKKTYTNHEAVKSVSFAVKKGECFGLLGMNGAGKTTVFQMLSRNLPTSEGKIYLQHCEVHEADALEYRRQYGYCPQLDVLLDFMTVYEVIEYFAQLQGLPSRDKLIISWLVKLDILQYKDHALRECSGGTKRKVNTILALLGGPSVVLLDEPTTGVDPKSRHFLWRTIKTIQRKNQTILLTSHSMDECEELCNRLSIMVDGQLRCVGTIPQLKKRHGQGYNLWLKVNSTSVENENAQDEHQELLREVNRCFEASLHEEHKGLLKFIVSPSLKLSVMFEKIFALKDRRTEQIVHFSINESSFKRQEQRSEVYQHVHAIVEERQNIPIGSVFQIPVQFVQQVEVCTNIDQFTPRSALQFNFYVLLDPDPVRETINHDNEEVEISQHWLLPSRELHGLWESLIFEKEVKDGMLAFAETSMLFARKGVDRNLVTCNRLALFHGPPGTGKTSLCKAIAQKLSIRLSDHYKHAHLVEINSHSLFSRWFSESGKLVQKVFGEIVELLEDEHSLVCVLVDEIESIAYSRDKISSNEPSDSIRVVNAVLTQLDRLRRFSNVFILATSNLTDSIDTAFLDRADLVQYIGNPTEQAIYEIYRMALHNLFSVGIIKTDDKTNRKLSQSIGEHLPSHGEATDPGRATSNTVLDILLQVVKLSEGLSGRTLRKIPFLAHALYVKKESDSMLNFLAAMRQAIRKVRNDKAQLAKRSLPTDAVKNGSGSEEDASLIL
uniref:ABC transporter domain-containing protein n=1 Tax=Anopheles dirus TaxID=7168 RepID=A0A182NQE0_9DIPT